MIASRHARSRGRRALRAWGVDPIRFAASDRRWWKRFLDEGITLEEFRIGRLTDIGLTADLAASADLAYRAATNSVNLRLGARQLLRELRGAGMVTVILTNGAVDPQRRKLEGSGLLGLVDAALVSEEVGWHKPDGRAFAAALTAVEGRPETSAMVGDHLEADICGALQAGFQRAIWLAPRWRNAYEDPRVTTVRRLDQVLTGLMTVARPLRR